MLHSEVNIPQIDKPNEIPYVLVPDKAFLDFNFIHQNDNILFSFRKITFYTIRLWLLSLLSPCISRMKSNVRIRLPVSFIHHSVHHRQKQTLLPVLVKAVLSLDGNALQFCMNLNTSAVLSKINE